MQSKLGKKEPKTVRKILAQTREPEEYLMDAQDVLDELMIRRKSLKARLK